MCLVCQHQFSCSYIILIVTLAAVSSQVKSKQNMQMLKWIFKEDKLLGNKNKMFSILSTNTKHKWYFYYVYQRLSIHIEIKIFHILPNNSWSINVIKEKFLLKITKNKDL